jgi:hypothetical protein
VFLGVTVLFDPSDNHAEKAKDNKKAQLEIEV